ncbi:MAG TPA: muconolactone Delta-isomerase family protein [Acidimicrobiales bacterium]|nr:muconolactone Delta-isomerase family protein [Acidimicrobiales bacterium]
MEFDIEVPAGTTEAEVDEREQAEASAAATLVDKGHLLRVWKRPLPNWESRALGLYSAGSESELETVLDALPLHDWMTIKVTPLEPHPNDPLTKQGASRHRDGRKGAPLPHPTLTLVYRLDATLGEPLDLGDTAQGRLRIVPQTGGTFTGSEINGQLVPGASADWQTILPDGTTLADMRYTLRTNEGALLYVQSRGVRHGSKEVLARLGRGEAVDASEYTFRTSTRISTAGPGLDWLNKGVFISVGGRQPAGVIYETYLVG